MKNTISINTKTIVNMKNNEMTTVWANRYNSRGIMTDSTPYPSIMDDINATNELVEKANPYLPEHLRFARTGEFYWKDGREHFSTIQIQLVGNPLLHIKNEWTAISANYSDEIPRSDWFINLLYQWYGLDIEGLERFASQFYEEGLNRIFCEEDELND